MDELIQRIKIHEGLNQSAYPDSLGYLTIAYGKLVDARLGGKLSLAACEFILTESLTEARAEVMSIPVYHFLDKVRAEVLIELCYAMNAQKVKEFTNMLAAMQIEDYIKAADELSASLWAKEVGKERTQDLVFRLRYGRYK